MIEHIIDTPWDIISAFIILLMGWLFCASTRGLFGLSLGRVSSLYIWHSMFCLVYLYYVYSYGGDAFSYYTRALTWDGSIAVGTYFIIYINYALINTLDLSLLGCFIFFNFFGAYGLILLDSALSRDLQLESPLFRKWIYFLPFLPSLSFWSSAIGKDSLSFLSVCLFVWVLLDLSKRKNLLIIAVSIMLLVRPHMAVIMVGASSLAYIISGQLKITAKFSLIAFVTTVSAFLIPFTLKYTGLNNISNFDNYVDERQSHNTQGGGGIDLSTMSLPEQVFSYLFRPLPFEANSAMSLVSSIENMLLLIFCSACMFLKPMASTKSIINGKALIIYCLAAILILSITTSNLGIAVRQKLMVLPAIFLILITYKSRLVDDRE